MLVASSQAHTSEYKIQKDYTSMHQASALPHGGKMPSIMFFTLKKSDTAKQQ